MVFTAARITEQTLRSASAGTTHRSDSLYELHTSPQFAVPSPRRCVSSSLRINTPKCTQPKVYAQREETRLFDRDEGYNATGRISLRLRNLGSDDDDDEHEKTGFVFPAETRDKRLGDLLRREWVQIDSFTADNGQDGADEMGLPWDREEERQVIRNDGVLRKTRVKPPTVAELTLEDEELRRLRGVGMFIKKTITIPKAGLTKEVMEKIHEKWRKEEVVRLKFHEVLARDMKTAHSIVEVRSLLSATSVVWSLWTSD